MAFCARAHGIRNRVVPRENAAEASAVEGVSVYRVDHLSEVVTLLSDSSRFTPVAPRKKLAEEQERDGPDVREVKRSNNS